MRPLPPFNLRPVRKKSVVKAGMPVKGRQTESAGEPVVKVPKELRVKPAPLRQKPQLKVLGEKVAC